MILSEDQIKRYLELTDPKVFLDQSEVLVNWDVAGYFAGKKPVTVPFEQRDSVIALLSWIIHMANEQTVVWMSPKQKQSIAATSAMSKFVPDIDQQLLPNELSRTVQCRRWDNHNCLINARGSEWAVKGLAISHLIVDGVSDGMLSKIFNSYGAFLAYGMKMIVIQQPTVS